MTRRRCIIIFYVHHMDVQLYSTANRVTIILQNQISSTHHAVWIIKGIPLFRNTITLYRLSCRAIDWMPRRYVNRCFAIMKIAFVYGNFSSFFFRFFLNAFEKIEKRTSVKFKLYDRRNFFPPKTTRFQWYSLFPVKLLDTSVKKKKPIGIPQNPKKNNNNRRRTTV